MPRPPARYYDGSLLDNFITDDAFVAEVSFGSVRSFAMACRVITCGWWCAAACPLLARACGFGRWQCLPCRVESDTYKRQDLAPSNINEGGTHGGDALVAFRLMGMRASGTRSRSRSGSRGRT